VHLDQPVARAVLPIEDRLDETVPDVVAQRPARPFHGEKVPAATWRDTDLTREPASPDGDNHGLAVGRRAASVVLTRILA
jgi:hypothetical protein